METPDYQELVKTIDELTRTREEAEKESGCILQGRDPCAEEHLIKYRSRVPVGGVQKKDRGKDALFSRCRYNRKEKKRLTALMSDDRILSIKSHEGVASVYRSKSTYWPFGLACFKLRDSCIAETIRAVRVFQSIYPSIVFETVLGFLYSNT